jgi:hypothetical protein
MRLPILFGSMLLLSAAGFSSQANAQGIANGRLKQMTAPMIGGNIELLAIGYEADTVDSDEKPSLFGFSGHIDVSGSGVEPTYAMFESAKPNGDCLSCELREEAVLQEEQFAYSSNY